MFGNLAKKLFGSANDRFVNKLRDDVKKINALEPHYAAMSDETLRSQTKIFKQRLAQGEALDQLLVDAFAVVREAAKRSLNMRHFDVQLMGGMVLHRGMIAEMRTGEGKTLVATLPVYLNALNGKGVHVITVNDYLAKRDAEWMGRVYQFLGLSVGLIQSNILDQDRRAAYACDVTYGTNHEFGFDYLRDNMKFDLGEMVQRPFAFAIVDEVDSILIDEARTPLIISGPSEDSSDLYIKINSLIPKLTEGDVEKDEKSKSITLTEAGVETIEGLLKKSGLIDQGSLYDLVHVHLVHHVNQALRAHHMFTKDVDYIVKDDKIIIIDEFTGRMMDGRRYSEGLHQALEAKEGVKIQVENQTLASVTYQNYFRLYPKLAGMTGTAMTEAGEFAEIYNLDVVEIPTHVPCVRQDWDDEIYRSQADKNKVILELVQECHRRKQPVLVGTVSIEKSEQLSDLLKKAKIKHQVLNARYHEQEAHIIAQAGKPGAVTIATNMAGRGTDIQLGGHLDMELRSLEQTESDPHQLEKAKEKARAQHAADRRAVLDSGGLYIIGTERHESRRIDNQLRGRAGRQGDPGASKFFVSLDDDLMRIFGSDRRDALLKHMGWSEGESLAHRWINKALERAQQKVEARNFEIRKQLLKYDNVMNDQRKVVYEQRKELLGANDLSETITDMRSEVLDGLQQQFIPEKSFAEQWNVKGLHEECLRLFDLDLPLESWAAEEGVGSNELKERIREKMLEKMADKDAAYTPDLMRKVEKQVILRVLDQQWKEHLLTLDHLRQGINLRAYAQRDPLNEYKHEAFNLFEAMLSAIRERVVMMLSHVQIRTQESVDAYSSQNAAGASAATTSARRDLGPWGKVQRNSPCPCGSGKKYKHCHGNDV